MPSPTELTAPKQLVVEGKDSMHFFEALLRFLGISDVQVQNSGGVGELRGFLKALLITPNFSGSVASLGIVRDAENSAPSAAQSVCSALSAANLTVPSAASTPTSSSPQVSYFILPDNSQPGMLETLCLRSVARDPVMPCVHDFFTCINDIGLAPSNMDKARIQAYLASKRQLRRLLGEAANASYWPWHDPVFDDLKQFLQGL